MKIIEMLEIAIKSTDPLIKALPAIKLINQSLPFPERRHFIRDIQIVKNLLMIYPLMKEPIYLIIQQMFDIFCNEQEWMIELIRVIESIAMISIQQWMSINEIKEFALDLFESILYKLDDMQLVDDKCYVLIVFLKHAESEQLVMKVMSKIQLIKHELQFKMKTMHQFEDLVEQTVLQMYIEEQNRKAEEQHHRIAALELAESIQKKQKSQKQLEEEPIQQDEIFIDLDQLLTKDEIPTIDEYQAEYFKNQDNLLLLVSFITDPLAVETSLYYEADPYADCEITIDLDSYKRFYQMKLDRSYILRSFKTMLFLTDLKNHNHLQQINERSLQTIFRSIQGFFQNALSLGNLTHIICLLQFYLKYETSYTIYYVLNYGIHYQLLDYLYNSYVVDFLLRIIDPQNKHLPQQVTQLTMSFLICTGLFPYIVMRIVNLDLDEPKPKEPQITREGYNILKKIQTMKIYHIEEKETRLVQQQMHHSLDTLLGFQMPGKSLNQMCEHRQMQQKSRNALIRRHSELNSIQYIQQLKQQTNYEYISLKEFKEDSKDIDNIRKDVIDYIITDVPLQETQSQQEIQSKKHTRTTSELVQQIHDVKKIKKYEYEIHQRVGQMPNKIESIETQRSDLIIDDQISQQENLANTFRLLYPLQSPPSASKLSTYYPNSDNSIVDVLMNEKTLKYTQQNNENISFLYSNFLKLVIDCFDGQHPLFEQLLDEKLDLLDKLFQNYNLKLIDQYEKEDGSSIICGQIISKLLLKIQQQKYERIFYLILPKACRNLVKSYQFQKKRLLHIQSCDILNPFSFNKLILSKIINSILEINKEDWKVINKLNDTALHILTLQLFTHSTNNIYQQLYSQLIRTLFENASDRIILTLLFKINLLESLSAGYSNIVINQVIISQWNIDSLLLYFVYISQIIVTSLEYREDLIVLNAQVKRCQGYTKLNELLKLFLNKKKPKIITELVKNLPLTLQQFTVRDREKKSMFTENNFYSKATSKRHTQSIL